MARVTVEDCIEHIPNRFALVHATAERTKHLVKGSRYVGEPCDNKFIVKALREIAAGKVRLKNDLEAIHQIQEEL
jgi:DNA-directed RNA polymerase subunit omega